MNRDCMIKNDSHYKLLEIMSNFRKDFHFDRLVGIKKSEMMMMMTLGAYVDRNMPATVSQISEVMRMTSAAVSKTISSLEDQGFLIKVVNKEDKRQAYLDLTEKGKEKLVNIKEEMNSFADAVFTKFGSENLEKLYDLLKQMNKITEEEIKFRTKKNETEGEPTIKENETK